MRPQHPGRRVRQVTPVGHAFSGGNVVFGTSPGPRGQVLEHANRRHPRLQQRARRSRGGHSSTPASSTCRRPRLRDGVAELIRVNPELEKIFIMTEKMSVHDAREIRAMAQANGIDIFGGNSLGVADSWNRVRIGGALGGDNPEESLKKGSIAIFSNSGNFTTTIAQYLRMAGWGTTTLISSGKDVYIHYAAPEFAFALANDARSKAAVLYCGAGRLLRARHRVRQAGRGLRRRTLEVEADPRRRPCRRDGGRAATTPRTRSAGSWRCSASTRIFTPESRSCSAKGAVVTNIAHIPAALTAVMALNGVEPDFAPEGNLALKPWFGNDQGLRLPTELDLPVVRRPRPTTRRSPALSSRSAPSSRGRP